MLSPVPVTIVTGFLGAGKTTLLNRVLREPHGMRICVIENEFADDMGVESLILKDGIAKEIADGVFELPNGCMCCSVRDDLILTLERVLQRRAAFDYVLVEPSGMASPGPVASAFFEASEEGSALRLDGIITVVDTGRVVSQLSDPRPEGTIHEVAQQIACADVILLNKVDSVTEEVLKEVEHMLRGINGSAVIHRSVRCEVDLRALLNIQAFHAPQPNAHVEQAHEHSEQCGCGSVVSTPPPEPSLAHAHDGSIRTAVFTCSAPLHLAAFKTWMGGVLWEGIGESSLRILRGKGVLCVQPYSDGDQEDLHHASVVGGDKLGLCASHFHPSKHIFQAVAEQFDVYPATGAAAAWVEGTGSAVSAPVSRIVLIGRGLQPGSPALRTLQDGLSRCAASTVPNAKPC